MTTRNETTAARIAATVRELREQFTYVDTALVAVGLGADQCIGDQYGFIVVVGESCAKV